MPKTYQRIVVLTGAGISAESGIRTFRDGNGLWENHRVEDVASPEGFARDPKLVLDFYNQRRQQLLSGEVHANAAHEALAKLEREHPTEVLLVTQKCDLFVSIGTSGAVYPAAGFVSLANAAGADTVILNLEESDNNAAFDRGFYGQATEVVTAFVEQLLAF